MEFATPPPDLVADGMVAALRAPTKFKPVEVEGAERMLTDLL